ncbi:hypothetical protein FACS1894193_13440 [Bacilli bacterium]|nr:hypothetical protein FACS1894193_13440 [Bacilli bacterium]
MKAFSERDKSQTLAVLTREALQSYQIVDKKLVGNGSVPIKTADVVNDSLLIDNTLLFSTGHVTSSTKDFYIYTLDLKNGDFSKHKRQYFPTTGEVKDSQHFYTLTSEAGLKTTVQQFSKTGKLLKEAMIAAPSVGTQVFEYGNETFVMAGTEDLGYDETYYRGRLHIFDTKTLAYKRYIDLEADDAPYRKNYSSMQVINGIGYCFSDAQRKRHDTTPMEPDNTLLTYEFATGEMKETSLAGTPTRWLSKSSDNDYLIYVLADEEAKSSLRLVNMLTGDEHTLPADELIGKSSQIDVINHQYVVVAGKNHLGLYDLLTGTFLDDIKLKEKENDEADLLVKLSYLSE